MSAAPYITELEVFGPAQGHWHEDRAGKRWRHEHPLPVDIEHRHRSFPPEPVPEYPSVEDHGAWLLWPALLEALLALAGLIGGVVGFLWWLRDRRRA